jgi:cytoskeletal protein CcmA (bactofilin family)
MAWFDRNPSGKKGAEEEHHTAPGPQPAPAPASPEPVPVVTEVPRPSEPGLVASLHKGSRVTGQLTFQGAARIDGSVEGEIQCHGKLTIGEGAEVRAKIGGQIVVIQGRVEGNVTAAERIELASPARVYGNINTPRLIVTEGVVFEGDCSMGVAKQNVGAATTPSANVDKNAIAKAPKRQADSEH